MSPFSDFWIKEQKMTRQTVSAFLSDKSDEGVSMAEKIISYKDIMTLPNTKLNEVMARQFYKPVPINISSADDMLKAGELLARITNSYSYLMVLYARIDAEVRAMKKDKDKKEECSDLIGKRNTLEAYIDILKQSYTGLSREISTRQEALKEINMSKSIT